MIDQEKTKEDVVKQAKILFRAGAWVSAMDEKGGGAASAVERNAIAQNLRKFATEPDYASLVPVFNMVLSSNRAWNEWSKEFSNFTSELKTAKPDLSLELRQCIYDLAYCVATRYRERNLLMAMFASIRVSFRNFVVPHAQNPELPAYLNISPVEKSALNELAEILDMPQRHID